MPSRGAARNRQPPAGTPWAVTESDRPKRQGDRQCARCDGWFGTIDLVTQNVAGATTELCRPCYLALAKQWSEFVPPRRARYKRVYGITPEQHGDLFVSQAGRCAVCSKGDIELVVDHDHDSGQVRGLLCSPCNTALGLLQDDPEVLTAATSYLLRAQRLARGSISRALRKEWRQQIAAQSDAEAQC